MRYACVSLLAVLMICSWSWAEDKRLVAQYSFDEGAGTQAKDGSGKGNDGKIQGATFVKGPKGYALKFDGVDDFVDCGVDKSLQQLELAGTIELWFQPEEFQGGLANWSSGSGLFFWSSSSGMGGCRRTAETRRSVPDARKYSEMISWSVKLPVSAPDMSRN